MEEKDDLIKNSYGKISAEKLKAVIKEILNSKPHDFTQDYIDRIYQSMTPEARDIFDKAIKDSLHSKAEQELWIGRRKEFKGKDTERIEEYNEAKQTLNYNPTSKGKVRKKNTHLIQKKKKRKK